MADPISDAVLLDVLDRACVLSLPLLDALRADVDDPADVLAEARRPGRAEDLESAGDHGIADLPLRVVRRLVDVVIPDDDEWAALPEERRRDWWVSRISNVASLASGLPRLAGRAADLLPLRNALGAAVQALAVLAVARERGIRGREQQVSLLARILIERDLPPARVREVLTGSRDSEANIYREEALGTPQSRSGWRGKVGTLWRVARLLSRIDGALDERPKGWLGFRALAQLPVVGLVGGYAAERGAVRRAADRAEREIRTGAYDDGIAS